MGLKVENKNIVVPGEVLADGMDFLPGEGVFRDGNELVSSRIGLASVEGRVIKLIPLAGNYLPKVGDRIICKVIDVSYSGWRVDTNTAYSAVLSVKEAANSYIERGADLTKILNFGDYIIAKIVNVTSQNLIDISLRGPGLHRLSSGRIIEVSPVKVPRIIGKQGSMVTLIKEATGCIITVGQNGLIWLRGENPEKELLAVETIRMIERNAHKQGLTDTVQQFITERGGKVLATRSPARQSDDLGKEQREKSYPEERAHDSEDEEGSDDE